MTKVVVAMSGGVDSSVAAALLKDQGFDVVGMMLRLWSEPGKEDSNRCCTPDAMALARRVAAQLDIPFYAVDARQVFHDQVVTYFLEEYSRGNTPNPCLVCNRVIRWKFLLEHALAMGADFMATGHYVRLATDLQGKKQLLRAVDASKDQSYVLHVLDQSQLSRALFPVGEFSKEHIRSLAVKFSLPTASRPDSQDLCFLAGGDYRDFIRRNAPGMLTQGPIIDQDGNPVGTHSGLAAYTIGQRKGLGIAFPIPLYVHERRADTNTLVVAPAENLGRDKLVARQMRWISGEAPSARFSAHVKTRYTAKSVPAEIELLDKDSIHVHFPQSQRDITPGQAAVLYQDDLMLGGGIIV